jgi:hypothetical protein
MTFGTDIKQWYSIQTPANLDLDLKKFDLVNRYGTSLSTNAHGYVPLVVNTFRSFRHHDLSLGLYLE